jgi:phosphoglycolate phosphatase
VTIALPPPTIVFDLDGTLVDTAGDLIATLNAILAREGLAPIDFSAGVAKIGGGARAMLQSAFVAAGRDLTPDRLEALFGDFLEYYGRHLADTSKPYPGVDLALARFDAAGWRLAVCTNKYEAPARELLDRLGLMSRFSAIAGQDTYGVAKPDPRHLTETIAAAGGSADRAVMVGDSATDVETAAAAGIPSIVVSFGYSQTPAAALGATAVIGHFDELYDAVAAIVRQRQSD